MKRWELKTVLMWRLKYLGNTGENYVTSFLLWVKGHLASLKIPTWLFFNRSSRVPRVPLRAIQALLNAHLFKWDICMNSHVCWAVYSHIYETLQINVCTYLVSVLSTLYTGEMISSVSTIRNLHCKFGMQCSLQCCQCSTSKYKLNQHNKLMDMKHVNRVNIWKYNKAYIWYNIKLVW